MNINCPICGKKLKLNEFPDTGTSVDFYEGICKNGHEFLISIENQDGSFSIKNKT